MTKPRYADDADLTIRDAVGVIEHIAPSNHVALVTHGDLRRPEEPRYDRLATEDLEQGSDEPRETDCGDTAPIQIRNNDDRSYEVVLEITQSDERILRETYSIGADSTDDDLVSPDQRLEHGETYDVAVRENNVEYGPDKLLQRRVALSQ